jgi:hypothetical protein
MVVGLAPMFTKLRIAVDFSLQKRIIVVIDWFTYKIIIPLEGSTYLNTCHT